MKETLIDFSSCVDCDDAEWEDVSDEDDIFTDNTNEQEDDPSCNVSNRIRARRLSICRSVSYLCGDALRAVQCMEEASVLLDPSLIDSKIKLGSLLIDMDDIDKVR